MKKFAIAAFVAVAAVSVAGCYGHPGRYGDHPGGYHHGHHDHHHDGYHRR